MDGVISEMLASYQMEHAGLRIDRSYGYDEVKTGLRGGSLDLVVLPMKEAERSMRIWNLRQFSLWSKCDYLLALDIHCCVKKAYGLKILRNMWSYPLQVPLYHDLRRVLEGDWRA